jgi:hypothetical protein
MAFVPILAHAGKGLDASVNINDEAPDGPDPVTTGLNVSYDVRVHNNGPDPFVAEVEAQTTGARFITWYPQGPSEWECSESGPSDFSRIVHAPDLSGDAVSCDGPLLDEGDTSHLHLVVKAPEDPGVFTTEVTVSLDGFPDDVESTTAEERTGDDVTGFIPEDGGRLKTDRRPDEIDNTNSVIRTRNNSGPGGVFDLHDTEEGPNDFCGGQDCDGKFVVIEIPKGYKNEENPPRLKLVYDESIAEAAEDATIYGQKDDGPIFVVPECDVNGIAEPSPCHGPALLKNNGDVRYLIYILSGDPIFGRH